MNYVVLHICWFVINTIKLDELFPDASSGLTGLVLCLWLPVFWSLYSGLSVVNCTSAITVVLLCLTNSEQFLSEVAILLALIAQSATVFSVMTTRDQFFDHKMRIKDVIHTEPLESGLSVTDRILLCVRVGGFD